MCWCSTALQWQTPHTHTQTHSRKRTHTHSTVLHWTLPDGYGRRPNPGARGEKPPHAGRQVGTEDTDGWGWGRGGLAGESCEKGARTRRQRARPHPAFRYRYPADVFHWLVPYAANSESESKEINADDERRPRWLGPQWRRRGSLLMGVSD